MILFCFLLAQQVFKKCMVKICENFAIATKLKFSSNIQIEKGKPKCLIFHCK